MKKILATITLIFLCSQLIATQIENIIQQAQREAQVWAQEVVTLETKEQKALTTTIQLSFDVAKQDQLFRKFMTGFLTMMQTICEIDLQKKETTYTPMDLTKISIALLTAKKTYKKTFNSWKTQTEQFEKEKSVFSEKCITLYEKLKHNIQNNLLAFLQQHAALTKNLLENNKKALFLVPETIHSNLQELYNYTDQTMDSIKEEQKTLFSINMLNLAGDTVRRQTFAAIQAATQANKPKEILQQVIQSVFQAYLEQLESQIQTDHTAAAN